MIIYKITLSILGDNFFPDKPSEFDTPTIKCFTSFSPTDISNANGDKYEFGTISFMHNNIFTKRGDMLRYYTDFVEFLEKHHSNFINCGGAECHIFTEVYYSGSQCNFEILGTEFLSRLNNLDFILGLPVSVYKMKKEKIKELLDTATH